MILPGRQDKPLSPLIVPLFLPHAGCPHRCIFCDQESITGQSGTRFSQNDIHLAMAGFLKHRRASGRQVQIAFYGGNFLGLPKAQITTFLDTASAYVESGHAQSIRFSTRPDTIERPRLDLIGDYPVAVIELGVQSMDDHVLESARRGHRAEDTRQAVSLLASRRYQIGLQLMTGLPGETEKSALASAQAVVALKPDFVRIYPTIVFRNSGLAKRVAQKRYRPMALGASVTRVKKLYLLFCQAGIPVVRMGLQDSIDFKDASTVIAGPHHPAFGHLVHSEIFLDMAISVLNTRKKSRRIMIRVHPRNISRMQGQKNGNLARLKNLFGFQTVTVAADPAVAVGGLEID